MPETSVAKVVCEARGVSAIKRYETPFKNLVVCCDVCDIQLWGNGPVLTSVKPLSDKDIKPLKGAGK